MTFFNRTKQPGWLVLLPRPGALMLAHVSHAGARPRVAFCELRDCDPSDPRSIQGLANEFRAGQYRCATLLSPDQYQMFVVEAPNVRPDELKAAVRWRVKDMLDFHVDDAVMDVLDIPAPPGAATKAHFMYAVVARAADVRQQIDFFEQANFALEVVDIPEAAQRNLAAPVEPAGKGIVLVSFDEFGGLITFSSGGELYLSRRIDVTAEKLSDDDKSRRDTSLDRAALEVQRSLDHFERQFAHVPLDRVLVAPLPASAELIDRIGTNIFLPTQGFDPKSAVDWPDNISSVDERFRWLKLIGAGLRTEAKAA